LAAAVVVDTVYPPGSSPFKTKGNVYRALFESADARVPGGRAAVLARIEDPALLAFYNQSFLAASTYDILPIVPFGVAGAKIVDLPYGEFVRGGAEFTARRDMHGIYRVLLRLASPERVAARLPRILSQYFAFGRIDGHFPRPKTYEATASGLPRPLALWLTSVAHGFVPVVIEKAGGRDVSLRIKPFTNPTVEQGVTLVTASFEVTWR
jgi:hypothetical protein